MRARLLFTSLPFLVLIAGCAKAPVATADSAAPARDEKAVEFLKWSMDKMAALDSYQARVNWAAAFGDSKTSSVREVAYQKPNQFLVMSKGPEDLLLTSVSDGKELIEFGNKKDIPSQRYPAPANFFEASSMFLKHPMFGGSLVNLFFGGSHNYFNIVSEEHGISFGPDQNVNGEPAHLVKFYGTQSYGNVEAVIGTKSGLVYRLQYDSEPLHKAMEESGEKASKSTTTETYTDIKVNQPVPVGTFAVKPPAGSEIVDAGAEPSAGSPVPIGKPAPDVTLASMDGKPLKLSSLKGKVVLIDFWATWCPPCREGLPITNKMHNQFAAKGLQVLTVSDEDVKTISDFIAENKYTFPSYRDPEHEAAKAYKVDGIPTLVILDAKGNLSSYTVGLEPEAAIIDKLKKAGLKI